MVTASTATSKGNTVISQFKKGNPIETKKKKLHPLKPHKMAAAHGFLIEHSMTNLTSCPKIENQTPIYRPKNSLLHLFPLRFGEI